jgi:hypothetical protein
LNDNFGILKKNINDYMKKNNSIDEKKEKKEKV